ncbi:MAG: AAA family ATPase, partial [Christensenella sp.]
AGKIVEEANVVDLFTNAKKNTPCIVFIDEIDAVGRQRGAGLGGGHDEREQTLNQLLVEMDGFEVNEGIIVMAATNRRDILDPALLRAGRFDRQITVNYPDVKGREEILAVHAKGKPFDSEVDFKVIARRTPGFIGADLENVLNEAAILTARRRKKQIGMSEIEESITRVIAGPEKKSRVMTEGDRRCTAYHEVGHAILAHMLDKCDPVHEVSIIPRGMAAGYTMTLPEEDKQHVFKSHLMDEITMMLGGRVAESLTL